MGVDPTGEISIADIGAALLRHRRLIIATTIAGMVVGLSLALLKPTTYTTSFSFVPQAPQEASRAGLASLAGQFGITIGGAGSAQSPQFYADLLRTREVLTPIVRDSFAVAPGTRKQPLPSLLKIRAPSEPLLTARALRAMRQRVISSTVATRTTGVISVSVTTESSHLSLQIADRLVQGLNSFNLLTRQSQAAEERRFVESRLRSARSTLREAENALERFLLTNRAFGNSPTLSFAKDRLQREVLLQQEVVNGLSQSYEEARIREVRDTPVLTLVERPALAVEPNARGRAAVLAVATLVACALGALLAIVRDRLDILRAAGAHPGFARLAAEWRQLRSGRRA